MFTVGAVVRSYYTANINKQVFLKDLHKPFGTLTIGWNCNVDVATNLSVTFSQRHVLKKKEKERNRKRERLKKP